MAAEINSYQSPEIWRSFRFNEAAANGRGNRPLPDVQGTGAPERGFNEAAANGRGNPSPPPASSCFAEGFNEAAANGRGNRQRAIYRTRINGSRFNEAAANGRGNLAAVAAADAAATASMRPRRMAAEISSGAVPAARSAAGFNEAAANGRGNRPRRRRRARRRERASMRPRRMAAEIGILPVAHGDRPGASMRPRRMAAEISQSAQPGGAAEPALQ